MPSSTGGHFDGGSEVPRNGLLEPVAVLNFARFRAMPRLLDPAELALLRAMPGFDEKLLQRLRKARRGVFLAYLKELSADFRALERITLDRAANDPDFDPQVAEAVIAVKFRFHLAVWRLRLQLALPFLFPFQDAQGVRELVAGLLQPLTVRIE